MIYGSPPGGWAHGCRDDMGGDAGAAESRASEMAVVESVKWLRQGGELTPLP